MKSRILFIALIATCVVAISKSQWLVDYVRERELGFHPPSERERQRAIGSIRGLSESNRRAFASDGFEPIRLPGPHDWLANHRESGQTFEQFTASEPNRPNSSRNRIYFQPIGEFDSEISPRFEDLKRFAESYFGLDVKIMPIVPFRELDIQNRQSRFNGRRQYLTSDILEFLKGRVSDDAFCLLAITMEDLYPEESWSFVFGQASLRNRVGVYSFARYGPRVMDVQTTDKQRLVVLRRSCKVLAHETAHMFGIRHCIYFECIMNGSNSMRESDSRDIHMCPVCLRKLQWSTKSDVRQRYQDLMATYNAIELHSESKRVDERIKFIEKGKKGKK